LYVAPILTDLFHAGKLTSEVGSPMLLSVFSRHSADCKFAHDRSCRRCNCPKWVGGQVNGYYFRQSAKTRQWAEAEEVRVKLEEALGNIPPGPKPNPRYFFWSGNGDPKSAVADWQRSYRRLFKLANIKKPDGEEKRCHPHMFRDTFAVEMLLAGVPIDQVSLLLGHSSVKITEKSYSPFVKARQIQLQESVRNAWKVGPPAGRGPENAPSASSRPANRTGWQLIHSDRKSKATA